MATLSVPILLVDDEPDVLQTLSMVLENADYAVATAASAAHALRLAVGADFPVAVVDYYLIGSMMNGLELIARLHDVNPLTVCLLMTIYDKGAVGFQAAQAGAFDYLAKPFSTKLLSTAVRTAVDEYRHREQTRERLYVGDLMVDIAARRITVVGYMNRKARWYPWSEKLLSLVYLILSAGGCQSRQWMTWAIA
jgi:DNA-binding NtrC family response regulator